MKRQLLLFSLIGMLALLNAGHTNAQTRYLEEVFPNVDITLDVPYGANYSTYAPTVLDTLTLDLYEPNGDLSSNALYDGPRPLVILMHPGSFLPKGFNSLPFGNNRDSSIVEMATQLAKRGFVVAAIEYRLGWNPYGATQDDRAKSIIEAVYRAMQDARGCIRYFRSSADNGNPFNIDPYRVVVGGTNSGGYVALAVNSMNRPAEIVLNKFREPSGASFIDTSILGGFYGQGGIEPGNHLNYPGYSSAVQVVLNMGGAIGDTSWLDVGEAPIVNFHGELDPLTPYGTRIVTVSSNAITIVEVSGSYDIARVADAKGIQDKIKPAVPFTDAYTVNAESKSSFEGLMPFYGAANAYEPWSWYDPNDPNIDTSSVGTGFGSRANPYASKPKALNYIDTIMNYFVPRALEAFKHIDSTAVETADPDTPVGISDVLLADNQLKMYPNPATNQVMLSLFSNNYELGSVTVFDLSGREVLTDVASGNTHTLDISTLQHGVYVLHASTATGEGVIKKLIVE